MHMRLIYIYNKDKLCVSQLTKKYKGLKGIKNADR